LSAGQVRPARRQPCFCARAGGQPAELAVLDIGIGIVTGLAGTELSLRVPRESCVWLSGDMEPLANANGPRVLD
jgi:hypothetical protein